MQWPLAPEATRIDPEVLPNSEFNNLCGMLPYMEQVEFHSLGQICHSLIAPLPCICSSLCLQECDNLWWDAFTTEFFEDDAMLTITFCLEDGPKRYSESLRVPCLFYIYYCLTS